MGLKLAEKGLKQGIRVDSPFDGHSGADLVQERLGLAILQAKPGFGREAL